MKKALALCLALLLLCGCSDMGSIAANYRSLETLLPIETLGVDRDGARLRLSCSASAMDEQARTLRLWADGGSINSALELLQDYAPRDDLFLAHTQYILAGQALAEQSLRPLLDYVERSPAMRMNTPLLLIRGGTAKDAVLETGGEQSDITQVLHSLERQMEHRGDNHLFTCRDVAHQLAENGAALCGAVTPADFSENNADGEDSGLTLNMAGYGILKDGSLVGFLEQEAALGAGLIHGYLRALTLDLPQGVSLELDGCDFHWEPEWQQGKLVQLRGVGSLHAVVTSLQKDLELSDPALGNSLRAELCQQVEDWLTRALSVCRERNADCLDIGTALRESDPAAFAALGEDFLQQLPLRLSLSAQVDLRFDPGGLVPADGGNKS